MAGFSSFSRRCGSGAGDRVALQPLSKFLQGADTAFLGLVDPLLQTIQRLLGTALLHQCREATAELAHGTQGRALGQYGLHALPSFVVQPAATVGHGKADATWHRLEVFTGVL